MSEVGPAHQRSPLHHHPTPKLGNPWAPHEPSQPLFYLSPSHTLVLAGACFPNACLMFQSINLVSGRRGCILLLLMLLLSLHLVARGVSKVDLGVFSQITGPSQELRGVGPEEPECLAGFCLPPILLKGFVRVFLELFGAFPSALTAAVHTSPHLSWEGRGGPHPGFHWEPGWPAVAGPAPCPALCQPRLL